MKRIQKLVSMLEFQSIDSTDKLIHKIDRFLVEARRELESPFIQKVTDGDIVDGHYTIPDGVTEIGWGVFSKCKSLESITIPDGVTCIGEYAFFGCSSLKSINIPDGVTEIRRYAFKGCSSLESINIPDGVTKIGWYAFSGCTGLRNISLPKNVKLGGYVFDMCSTALQIEYR